MTILGSISLNKNEVFNNGSNSLVIKTFEKVKIKYIEMGLSDEIAINCHYKFY